MVLVTVVHFVPFTYERGKCDSRLYWNIKSEMSNPMMLQVHLNSRRPGPLQNSTTAVDMCCRLHASYFANVQKSEIVKLFTLLFFFFHWHYVKFCEAVVQKCMYKIPLFVDLRLLQKLWLREGGGTEGDQRKQLILCLHHRRSRALLRPLFLQIHIFWEPRVTVLYVPLPLRSPSQQTLVCVCKVNKAW